MEADEPTHHTDRDRVGEVVHHLEAWSRQGLAQELFGERLDVRAEGRVGRIVTLAIAADGKSVAGAHGVFNMSPQDHLGLDQRARVMVQIENGTWKLIK